MNSVAIGEKLRELRGSVPMETVARELKISKSAVSMYENGSRIPRDDVKMRIAKFYGKSVAAIFFDPKDHI